MIESTSPNYIHRSARLAISVAAAFFLAGSMTAKADVTLISEIPGRDVPVISGAAEESEKSFTPASTFKPIITLVAFKKDKVTLRTHMACSDSYLPMPKPADLDLQQAMYYSSNQYFGALAEKVGGEALLEMAALCHFGNAPGTQPQDLMEWAHGGGILVTPLQEHAFARRLAQDELPVDKKIQDELKQAMTWPATASGREVHGKTGSMSGIFWFNGFCRAGDKVRVITVMLNRPGATRDEAIKAFYVEAEKPFAPR